MLVEYQAFLADEPGARLQVEAAEERTLSAVTPA